MPPKTMTCEQCGRSNRPDARYCPHCGATLQSPPPVIAREVTTVSRRRCCGMRFSPFLVVAFALFALFGVRAMRRVHNVARVTVGNTTCDTRSRVERSDDATRAKSDAARRSTKKKSSADSARKSDSQKKETAEESWD